MSNEMKTGNVTVIVPEGVTTSARAGKMSQEEVAREIKSYSGLGLCCEQTASELEKNAARVTVPELDRKKMVEEAFAAEALASLVTDLEATLLWVKQNQLLLAGSAHRQLLRVLAFVRAHEKFDPRLVALFPHLRKYFKKTRAPKKATKTPEPNTQLTPGAD